MNKKQQRREARFEDYRNQNAQSAAQFNFDQHNRKGSTGTHISKQEARFIRDQFGAEEAYAELQRQKAAGATFGKKATKRMEKMGAKLGRIDEVKPTDTQPTNPVTAPAPTPTPAPVQNKAPQNVNINFGSGGINPGQPVQQPTQPVQQAPQPVQQAPQPVQQPTQPVQQPTQTVDQPTQEDLQNRSEAKERAQNYQPVPKNNAVRNTQDQVITQDNDQQSSVVGDDNYVYQAQDNSIRNYGGDNRVFNYQSSGDGIDTPASMATLAGFYAPDDSPGAQASRLDRHVTQNRDNQKRYSNTSHIAQGAISRAAQNAYIDPAALDNRINQRSEYHRAQAKLTGNHIFGDLFGMSAPTWNSAEPAKPVEKPDFDKMYDKYTDF